MSGRSTPAPAVVTTPAPIAAPDRAGHCPPGSPGRSSVISYGPYVVGAFLTDETAPMPSGATCTPPRPRACPSTCSSTRRTSCVAAERESPAEASWSTRPQASPATSPGLVTRTSSDGIWTTSHGLFPALRGRVRETVIRRWEIGLPHPATRPPSASAGAGGAARRDPSRRRLPRHDLYRDRDRDGCRSRAPDPRARSLR